MFIVTVGMILFSGVAVAQEKIVKKEKLTYEEVKLDPAFFQTDKPAASGEIKLLAQTTSNSYAVNKAKIRAKKIAELKFQQQEK